nr:hypothetical protein [Tanacetum cinerariifolium]
SLSISSKIDSLLDEFAGELTLLKSIPLGIDETNCDFEEDIRLIEKLLYDNSSPRPPEEFVSTNSNAASESFSPSPILVKDSDSLMDEIDVFCTPDYPMPPGIVDKDYDSEKDFLIHGDTGILNIKMKGDISDQKAFMHELMITLAPHQEKSPDLLSHRYGTVKKFNTHRKKINKKRTKSEQNRTKSRKNEKRGKARKFRRPITVKKAEKPLVPASVWGRVMEVMGKMAEWWRGAGNVGMRVYRDGGKSCCYEQWQFWPFEYFFE